MLSKIPVVLHIERGKRQIIGQAAGAHPRIVLRSRSAAQISSSGQFAPYGGGTVLLDAHGRALVVLPDWFEALNRDFRYQLTAIGAPAPDLHIAAEVSGGSFSIAGGQAGQRVSWQVTGIRQDAWANAHRIPVEVDKPAEDQGRYLHPELWGKDEQQLITTLARRRRPLHRPPETTFT